MTKHYAPLRMAASRLTLGTPANSNPMRTEDLITNKLTEAFEPQSLTVLDELDEHEGHAGHREGGQTHLGSISCRRRLKVRPGWNATA